MNRNQLIAIRAFDLLITAIFVYGGIVVFLSFILDINVNKTFFGAAMMSGWFVIPIASVIFLVYSIMRFLDKAPWYWESVGVLNFSFVLLVIALFRYNKDMGYLLPLAIIFSSILISWYIKTKNYHDNKYSLLVVLPSFVPSFGYYVPLFTGVMVLCISLLEILGRKNKSPD